MTFENALAKIQAKFAEVNGAKLADMAVQVTLTDEDCGGTLYFKVTDGTVDVQGYDYRDNDAVIDIERKSLMDILGGKTTLDNAIEKGKATVKGNFEKLATLKDAVPAAVKKVVEKKAPAKKAPAKKVPAKKAEAKPAAKKAEVKPVEKKAEVKPAEKKAPAVKKAAAKPAEKKAPVAKKTATKIAAKKA